MTKTMLERAERLHKTWKDEGDGYFSLTATSPLGSPLAYVAIPSDHPLVGEDGDNLSVDVNGGLTFSRENVFGWDYAHYENFGTPEGDIISALKYFRDNATK